MLEKGWTQASAQDQTEKYLEIETLIVFGYHFDQIAEIEQYSNKLYDPVKWVPS